MILQEFSDLCIVGEADNGLAAVSTVKELQPDVVTMDIGLPGIDGIEASRLIKAEAPQTKILVLTSHDRDDDIFAAVAAVADGYCLKDAAGDHIAMAIRAVASGLSWIDPAIAKRVLRAAGGRAQDGQKGDGVAANQGKKNISGRKFGLSEREMEVLGLVVQGLSNQEIANQLHVGVETVKSHMRHIMEKLTVSDRTQAAVKALREGLLENL